VEPFDTLICREDSDYARCMTFLLETRRAADPGLRTANAYAATLRVLTYGSLIRYEDQRGNIIGIVGYTIGSPHQEYEDRQVAYVEYCLMSAARQHTRFFPKGLGILARTIRERHPEAVMMSFAAAADHRRNNRLYAKFAKPAGRIEHPELVMNLYTTTLEEVCAYAAKFD